jgi:hypothetical protein
VHPFLAGLDIVRRLRPISYNWKEGGAQDIGLGAEDVAKVAPSLTLTNGKGEAEGVKYERLSIVDPVIVAPDEYTGSRLDMGADWQHPTAKRRNRWASPDEMFERFKDRPPFASWDRDVLRDYCEHGLLRDPSGDGFVLACPPEFEAAVYMAARGNAAVYDSVRALDVPVLLVRGGEGGGRRVRQVRDGVAAHLSPYVPRSSAVA